MTNTGERLRDLYYEYAWVTEKGNIIPLWSDIAFLYGSMSIVGVK